MTRISGVGGWELTVTYDMVDVTVFAGYLSTPSVTRRYHLNGLVVTPQEADAIMTGRSSSTIFSAGCYPGPGVRIDNIEVTASEADAISRGACPLDVLLPRFSVRPLSEAEMREGAR